MAQWFGEGVIVLMAASLVAGWGAAQAQGGHPADRRLPLPAPSPLLAQPSLFAAATLRGCVAAPLLPYIFNTSTLHLVPLILLTPSWTPEAFPLAFPPLLLSPLPSSPIPSLPPLPPLPLPGQQLKQPDHLLLALLTSLPFAAFPT